MPDNPSMQPFPFTGPRRRPSTFRRSSVARAVVADVAPDVAPDLGPDLADNVSDPNPATADSSIDAAPAFTPPLSPQLDDDQLVSPSCEDADADADMVADNDPQPNVDDVANRLADMEEIDANSNSEEENAPNSSPVMKSNSPPGDVGVADDIQPAATGNDNAATPQSPVSPQLSPSLQEASSYELPPPINLDVPSPQYAGGPHAEEGIVVKEREEGLSPKSPQLPTNSPELDPSAAVQPNVPITAAANESAESPLFASAQPPQAQPVPPIDLTQDSPEFSSTPTNQPDEITGTHRQEESNTRGVDQSPVQSPELSIVSPPSSAQPKCTSSQSQQQQTVPHNTDSSRPTSPTKATQTQLTSREGKRSIVGDGLGPFQSVEDQPVEAGSSIGKSDATVTNLATLDSKTARESLKDQKMSQMEQPEESHVTELLRDETECAGKSQEPETNTKQPFPHSSTSDVANGIGLTDITKSDGLCEDADEEVEFHFQAQESPPALVASSPEVIETTQSEGLHLENGQMRTTSPAHLSTEEKALPSTANAQVIDLDESFTFTAPDNPFGVNEEKKTTRPVPPQFNPPSFPSDAQREDLTLHDDVKDAPPEPPAMYVDTANETVQIGSDEEMAESSTVAEKGLIPPSERSDVEMKSTNHEMCQTDCGEFALPDQNKSSPNEIPWQKEVMQNGLGPVCVNPQATSPPNHDLSVQEKSQPEQSQDAAKGPHSHGDRQITPSEDYDAQQPLHGDKLVASDHMDVDQPNGLGKRKQTKPQTDRLAHLDELQTVDADTNIATATAAVKKNDKEDAASQRTKQSLITSGPLTRENDSVDDRPVNERLPVNNILSDEEGPMDGLDSEVEFVEPSQIENTVSPTVKTALEALPVRNVAVVIPKFTKLVPPHPDDLELFKTVERYFDSHCTATKRCGILILVSSPGRAQKLTSLLNKHTKLKAAMVGIGMNARRAKGNRDGSLGFALSHSEVIVTLDKTALFDASRNQLDLRAVALLVLDSVEHVYMQAHTTSRFMKDYYRALPESARPRVLAIARKGLHIKEFAPVEKQIYTKFCESLTEAKWKSCYGRGQRPPENELLDIEELRYLPNVEYRDGVNDQATLAASRERRRRKDDLTALDVMIEEVGPLGVSLFQRRMALRQFRRYRYKAHSRDERLLQLSDNDSLLGVSDKMLKLINELYDAYRASTQSDRLKAVIFAGRPPVACAMAEVLKALPIFENLVIRVVVGNHGVNEVQDATKDFACESVQGEETDDDEISSFGAGDVNVLIVSSTYHASEKPRRPLSHCPLVIRFDGSRPKPSSEVGGCRSRVIVMRERWSSNMAQASNQSSHQGLHYARSGTGNRPENRGADKRSRENESTRKRRRPSPVHGGDVIDLDEAGPSSKTRRVLEKDDDPLDDKLRFVDEFRLNQGEFFSKTPKPFSGPHEDTTQCHLYRIILYRDKSEQGGAMLKEEVNIGVHNFLVVFSEKLSDDDLIMSLKDIAVDSGSDTRTAFGYVRLEYHGANRIPPNRLLLARRYTSLLFKHIYPSVVDMESKFLWDFEGPEKKARVHSDERRCYLVLPATEEGLEDEVRERPDYFHPKVPPLSSDPERNEVLLQYFGPSMYMNIPERTTGSVRVDWDCVKKLVDLQDDEVHSHEAHKSNGLNREKFGSLEGKLIFSTFFREGSILSGTLCHDLCPTTDIKRSVKFPLNEDGTLQPHRDLSFVLGMRATNKTIALQAKKSISPAEMVDTSHYSVRWCSVENCLVKTNLDISKRNLELFDCERNVMKRRSQWVGKVCYTMEHYYKHHCKGNIEAHDQPLLECARVRHFSLDHLLEALEGKSVTEICDELVHSGVEHRRVLPEKTREFPVTVGALFLPPILYNLEQHISACELRNKFDNAVQQKGSIAEVLKSVTSSCVNSKRNYERLELLGDSVLKLSCTVRLFRSRPHDSEGQMHDQRATLVSNARLYKLGKLFGIQNYLRSVPQCEAHWKPPGTDVRGLIRRESMKGVADVVEALCGTYFLAGSASSPDDEKAQDEDDKASSSDPDDDSEYGIIMDSSDDENKPTMNSKAKDGVIDVDAEDSPDKKAKSAKKSFRRSFSKRLDPASVERGYLSGCAFLKACGVFKRTEPTHKEVLLAGIHSLHSIGSDPPTDITHTSFPPDHRLTHPVKPWAQHFRLIEETIKYKFKRRQLLLTALTHGSYVKQNGAKTSDSQSYQRLEFLGDAVADFVVVRYLYEMYPELGPGDLTHLKGNVVSNESFARVSVTMGLHKFLYHNSPAVEHEIEKFLKTLKEVDLTHGGLGGETELKRNLGEIAAPKVLGDVFEAVLGAVYVDSGLQEAWRVCIRLLQAVLRVNANPLRDDVHPVEELQYYVKDIWSLNPNGAVFAVRSAYDKVNIETRKECTISILGEKIAIGRGTNNKRAKLMAAKKALALLQDRDENSRGAQLLKKLRSLSVQWRVAQKGQASR